MTAITSGRCQICGGQLVDFPPTNSVPFYTSRCQSCISATEIEPKGSWADGWGKSLLGIALIAISIIVWAQSCNDNHGDHYDRQEHADEIRR